MIKKFNHSTALIFSNRSVILCVCWLSFSSYLRTKHLWSWSLLYEAVYLL